MNKDKSVGLQDVRALFDTAWETYRANFVRLFRVNIVPMILVAVLVSVFEFLNQFGDMGRAFDIVELVSIFGVAFGVSVLVICITSMNYIAQVLTLCDNSSDSGNSSDSSNPSNTESTTFSVYKKAAGILFSYFGIMLLTGLIVLAGMMFLIVPGIVLFVWLAFGSLILITGNEKGIVKAMKLSKQYVYGIWTEVFARFAAVILFALLLNATLSIFQDFIEHFFTQSLVISHLLNLAYQLVVAPYFVVYGYELYKDVVNANEAATDPKPTGPDSTPSAELSESAN